MSLNREGISATAKRQPAISAAAEFAERKVASVRPLARAGFGARTKPGWSDKEFITYDGDTKAVICAAPHRSRRRAHAGRSRQAFARATRRAGANRRKNEVDKVGITSGSGTEFRAEKPVQYLRGAQAYILGGRSTQIHINQINPVLEQFLAQLGKNKTHQVTRSACKSRNVLLMKM